jgi:5'-nucleotidase
LGLGIGIELDGLVDKKMYKDTVYNNPVEASQEMVRILKRTEMRPDHLPSHLG